MKQFALQLLITIKRHRKYCAILVILQICITILNIISPFILQRTVDEGIVGGNVNAILFYTLLAIICLLMINTARLFFSKIGNKVKIEQSFWLKRKILNNLANGTLSFLYQNSSGNILKSIENDIAVLERTNVDWAVNAIIEIVGGLFAISLLFRIDPYLLIVIIIAESLIITIQRIIVAILARNARELRTLSGRSLDILQEYVSNIVSAIQSKTTKYQIKKYTLNESMFVKKLNGQYILAEANQLISNTIDGFLTVAIYFLGGVWVIKGKISYGELIAVSQYIALIVSPVLTILNSFSTIEMAVVSLEQVNNLLDMPLIIDGKGIPKDVCTPSIKFDDVSIGYETNRPVLKKVSMVFLLGSTYAIVGENGSGKSTLLKALYRLIDITEGKIYVNDHSLDDWKLDDLRMSIGIVPQQSLILNDTIYNNLKLGNSVSDIELRKAINTVDLGDTISGLDNGIESIVGDKGQILSGGQRQKIALARILLSGEKIIILDEATSAIDNISLKIIIKQIYENYKDRLVIIIAHRRSSIGNADYIYYLGDNTILEHGTLEELKNRKGKVCDLLFEYGGGN